MRTLSLALLLVCSASLAADAHPPASTCTPMRRAFIAGAFSWKQQPDSSIAPGNAPASIQLGTITATSMKMPKELKEFSDFLTRVRKVGRTRP